MSQSGESTPKATEITENPDNDLHAAMVGAHDIGSNSEMIKLTSADQHPNAIIQQSSALLRLPAEVRNWIWQLILLRGCLEISQGWYKYPYLLRTCRQIRREASPIYYHGNSFEVSIQDYRLLPHPAHWMWVNVSAEHITLIKGGGYRTGGQAWDNLKAWLKDYHRGAVPCMFTLKHQFYGHFIATAGQIVAVTKAFEVIETLQGSSWPTVEAALEAQKISTHAVGRPGDGSYHH